MTKYSPVRTRSGPALQDFFPSWKLGLKVWDVVRGNAVERRLTKETMLIMGRKAVWLSFIVQIVFEYNLANGERDSSLQMGQWEKRLRDEVGQ